MRSIQIHIKGPLHTPTKQLEKHICLVRESLGEGYLERESMAFKARTMWIEALFHQGEPG